MHEAIPIERTAFCDYIKAVKPGQFELTRHFASAEGSPMNQESALEIRRKRLRFRSWHRGMREVDLILGNFADHHLADFDSSQLSAFERILDIEDPHLYAWISGSAHLPEEENSPMIQMIINFKYIV